MKLLLIGILLTTISVQAFRPGNEGRINAPWTPPSSITIGQNTQIMIEELLQDINPELIPKIGKFGSDIYATIMPGVIFESLQKEIKESLGDTIFEEKEKLL